MSVISKYKRIHKWEKSQEIIKDVVTWRYSLLKVFFNQNHQYKITFYESRNHIDFNVTEIKTPYKKNTYLKIQPSKKKKKVENP